jgi:SAM-dependent methyltransferase
VRYQRWWGEGPTTKLLGGTVFRRAPDSLENHGVFGFARRLFRRFVPRRKDPLLDAEIVRSAFDTQFEAGYLTLIDRRDSFVEARYFEGMRWRNVLRAFVQPRARILDVGAGDGAIELALRAGGHRVVSIETLWNDVARRLGVARVIADAAALPFRTGVFDAVVCLETIEHLHQPRAVAAEMSRVARPEAVLLLTTPPRWRFAFAADPHFGIRGLVLMPPRWQRGIAAQRGFDAPEHFVDRIYGSIGQVERALRPFVIERVLSRSRMPRRWFWDAIVMRKK